MSAEAIVETLELQRDFNAPIERVFAAWTTAEFLARWFGPEGFSVVSAEVDCRLEGSYSITIQSPDGEIIRHFGQYLEIDEPNKLAFTWELENQACKGSEGRRVTTLVELRFFPVGNATRLRLKHEKLPDQAAVDGHRFGWTGSLDNLALFLNP